ncbi:MAG: hypothetical protein AAGU15_09720 [Anaerolineaceae bacterium]|jgi:hypothetical protein
MERKIVEFSEGEFVIRSYQCSVQKAIFSQASDGYLQVTNKRVIYANSTKSGGSSNLLVSEVPIEDVGSISSYIGKSLNIFFLLLFAIFMTLIASAASDVLPEWMTHWLFGFFLMLPFIVIWLMEKNILNQDIFERVMNNLEMDKEKRRTIRQPDATLRNILQIVFIIGLVLFIVGLMDGGGLYIFILPLAVFALAYLWVFSFQNEFGLSVSTRSASGSGLTIRLNNFLSLLGKNPSTPGKIVPTTDSYTVAKDLGALVLDLQQAGDLAVEKWSNRSAAVG